MSFLRDLFRPAKSGTGGLFNQASHRFAQLRYLGDDIAQQNAEIVEIIRLCQESIRASSKNGDPYVLLANALALASRNLRPMAPSHADFLLRSAGSVAYHWANTRLCQFPFTKNRQTGDTLYTMILAEMMSVFDVSDNTARGMLRALWEESGDRLVSVEALGEYSQHILGA